MQFYRVIQKIIGITSNRPVWLYWVNMPNCTAVAQTVRAYVIIIIIIIISVYW